MIYQGDARQLIQSVPDGSVDCLITSPPYWGLRDYGPAGQIGLEHTISGYVSELVSLFSACRGKLKPKGGLWIVIGDCYSGSRKGYSAGKNLHKKERYHAKSLPPCLDTIPAKSLYLMPERLALALIDDGWILRNKIVWHKRNAKPENVRDRCVTDYESVLFFTRQPRYYFCPSREGNHLMRTVWDIPTGKLRMAHTASYPVPLVERIIGLQCPSGGLVLDPFAGSGSTGVACVRTNRQFVGFEINPDYAVMGTKRINDENLRLPLEACHAHQR